MDKVNNLQVRLNKVAANYGESEGDRMMNKLRPHTGVNREAVQAKLFDTNVHFQHESYKLSALFREDVRQALDEGKGGDVFYAITLAVGKSYGLRCELDKRNELERKLTDAYACGLTPPSPQSNMSTKDQIIMYKAIVESLDASPSAKGVAVRKLNELVEHQKLCERDDENGRVLNALQEFLQEQGIEM